MFIYYDMLIIEVDEENEYAKKRQVFTVVVVFIINIT